MIPEYLEVMGPNYIDHVVGVSKMVECTVKKAAGPAASVMSVGNTAANAIGSIGSAGASTLLTLSVVTGVPVGILAHIIGKHVAKKHGYEQELIAEAEKYHEAAGALEREMARQHMKVV